MKNIGKNFGVLLIVILSIIMTFNNIENHDIKYYFLFLSLCFVLLIIINRQLKIKNIIKENQLFLPIFFNTLTLIILSLIVMFINHEKSMFNLITVPTSILVTGITYYLLKTMQP